jgi:hypothetical protein
MSHYYLVSSLPHLTLEGPVPFSAQEFGAMCEGVLSELELADMKLLLGLAEGAPQTDVVRRWLALEKLLTQETARTRADEAGVDLKIVQGYTGVVEPGVAHAFSVSNPGARELELDKLRWSLVEKLAEDEAYGFAAVVAFAVKLAMVARWSALSAHEGEAKLERLIAESAELDF